MLALRRATFATLVASSVLYLPLVHGLIARGEGAAVTLAAGLLSMGIAWSGGCALENRRRKTVRAIAALGVLLPLLGFVPTLPGGFEGVHRAYLGLASAFSALGLALLSRTPPSARDA